MKRILCLVAGQKYLMEEFRVFLKWAWIPLSLSRFSKCPAIGNTNTEMFEKKYDTLRFKAWFNLIWWHGETEREKGPVGLGRDQRLNRRDWEEWPRRALVKTPPWLETSEITKKCLQIGLERETGVVYFSLGSVPWRMSPAAWWPVQTAGYVSSTWRKF